MEDQIKIERRKTIMTTLLVIFVVIFILLYGVDGLRKLLKGTIEWFVGLFKK